MRTIKRYPNRKLYDTEAKQYIKLEEIADKIRAGEEIRVIDNVSGDDLTAITLTQIIYEEEKKQSGLLPRSLLTGMIQASGDRLSAFQRSLFSSLGFLHQIDQEIKRRIKLLVRQGELTEPEGQRLLDKLLSLSAYPIPQQVKASELEIESLISNRNIPTREDMDQLVLQLEELAKKLDELERQNE